MHIGLRFIKDRSAATAIEYAMIAAGIAVAIVAVVQGLGTAVNGLYTSVGAAMK